MRFFLISSLVVGLLTAADVSSASAQGSGKGLGQAAKTSGHSMRAGGTDGAKALNWGSRHAELGKAAVGRSNQNTLRTRSQHANQHAVHSAFSSGLNHALKQAGDTPRVNAEAPAVDSQIRERNRERIREQRFSQAEHLRGISEANGNERLQMTAERMETNAQLQYERRLGAAGPGTESVPFTGGVANDGQYGVPAVIAPEREVHSALPDSTDTPTRTSWLPRWLRRKSG